MKATDLMTGDWVIRRGVPEEPMRVYDIKMSAGVVYLDQDGRGVIEKFENIEPIPLTPEILEKNGCKKWTWHDYPYENVVTYAIRGGFQVEVTKKDGFWLVDNCSDSGDYGYESNWIADVNYVHKLQHLLKDLEIEKEIVI